MGTPNYSQNFEEFSSSIKRKRSSSDNSTLSAVDIYENLHCYGDVILDCSVHISKGIKEYGNEIVLRYTCALLNSGGGILHMRNMDSRRGVQSKDLDTWWGGMENKLAEMISGDDICNYFDLIGNFDDPDLFLFVKSAEHICTIDYHSRLPTDTATHEVSYHSVIKLLNSEGQSCTLSDLPPIPVEFHYGRTTNGLKQETKQIQFKQLSAPSLSKGKGLPDKIKYMVSKYISAFANHEGGHTYFGIDDVRAAVYGEEMSVEDQERTERLLQIRMDIVIWGDASFKVIRGQHWDVQFFPVQNCPRKKGRRMIVVVSVCKFPGGVFTAPPESYFINAEGNVESWAFNQWKKSMLNPFRDKPELHNRFVKVPIRVPQAPLVFSLKHTINDIKKKLLREDIQSMPQPKHYLEAMIDPGYRQFVKSTLDLFKGRPHITIFINCWGLNVSTLPPPEVVCDVLVLSEGQGCHLLTFAKDSNSYIWRYTRTVASYLKYRLVSLGGCTDKFGIICHVINVNDNCHEINEPIDGYFYPSHFFITSLKLESLLQALIITMAAYKPVDFSTLSSVAVSSAELDDILSSDTYYFLLTCDQFQLLWTQQFTKDLWIHSPPGAGKTVAAVQFVQELRRRGCAKDNILYLAENEMICSYVRSFSICRVSSRRTFLLEMESKSNVYGNVSNVVVDEAQNFKDRDGDWYSACEQLVTQTKAGTGNTTSGFFWVFMDYSQKVHKFRAGLPSVIGKNNFVMSEITRNSKEIFRYALHFMKPQSPNVVSGCEDLDTAGIKRVESVPKLGHDYASGHDVQVIKCEKTDIKHKLFGILSKIIDNGVDMNNLAILVGRSKEKTEIEADVKNIEAEKSTEAHVLVDSVKNFSGLDKKTIIGVNPRVNEDHADFDKFVLSLATRAKDNLIIISSAGKFKDRLEFDANQN